MKLLYRFHWDCGRGADVGGLFVAEEADVKAAIGRQVYLGEANGKHSEVYGALEEGDLKVLTDDQDFIAKFEKLIRGSGYNPLEYITAVEDEI